ncbi:hypothetical protein [Parachryseolinea silvisoli]|jgi:hypothetical protein|uniref:hypothetical protein n=1 Tax=Parachryseolinea silvisoli TaxID=2873601 RepID=UPI0022657F72|nr:hypothetical protein [Parachryseolinea silvisoli]MCD9019668.1 hypothetical protein [Parachryseolinea silvisoli]
MKAILLLLTIFVTAPPGQCLQGDSLVCAKEFSNVLTANYKTFLKRDVTGTFAVKDGDSIQYVLFQENLYGATFFLYDPAGKEIVKTHAKEKVLSGRLKGPVPGNYYYKIRSGRPFPNSFILMLNVRTCLPYTPEPTHDSTNSAVEMDTVTTVKIDSTLYLASTLNLKNKQSIRIEVDSLHGFLQYEIQSTGGPIKYTFSNGAAKTVKNGMGIYHTGTLPFKHSFYTLWLENDDPVAGKHVRVTIVQYERKRKPSLVK